LENQFKIVNICGKIIATVNDFFQLNHKACLLFYFSNKLQSFGQITLSLFLFIFFFLLLFQFLSNSIILSVNLFLPLQLSQFLSNFLSLSLSLFLSFANTHLNTNKLKDSQLRVLKSIKLNERQKQFFFSSDGMGQRAAID